MFSWRSACASAFVWFCVFIGICAGVKSTSWIVWVTVPVPTFFIVVMVFHGLSLEGS